MNTHGRCPHCQEAGLRTWDELSADEQEVVKRLPASADYPAGERQETHQWCTRCWYEAAEDQEHLA